MTEDTDLQHLLMQGFTAHRAGDVAAAVSAYDALLAIVPDQIDALRLKASALRTLGDLPGCLALFARVLALEPDHGDSWYNLGNALSEAGRLQDALEAYQRGERLMPGSAGLKANLGVTLAELGDLDGAIAAYDQALGLEPDHRIALHNLGNALSERGETEAAIALLSRAVALYPDLAEAHYNLGLNRMRLGDYTLGFRDYEWRWRARGFPSVRRHADLPDWEGRPLAGRRLLVHGEQGLGDIIQFVQLLPLVQSLARSPEGTVDGEVWLQVPQKLRRLMATVPGATRVMAESPPPATVDCQVPLMGLPHRLLLTPGSLPGSCGHWSAYLQAEPGLVAAWRQRLQLGGDRPGRAIGLVWQGNPLSPAEKGRSLADPALLAPFAGLPETRLIALQKLDPDRIEPADTPSGYRVAGLDRLIEHPGPDFDAGPDAFIDTAAILASLSGLVSVCTAPLHLAGALGRPAIGLIRKVPDWRWGEAQATSPWYPSLRLCRQTTAGDFGPAIEEAVSLAAAWT